MKKNSLKILGKITKRTNNKLLFSHNPENIPPLGVNVIGTDTLVPLTENNKLEPNLSINNIPISAIRIKGKIVDIIGSVKSPYVVVKLTKALKDTVNTDNIIFYYIKEDKKKRGRKRNTFKRKN